MDDFSSADAIITTSRHEVLLQLRDDRPDISWPAHWVVPGGRREAGETPYQTARRELREETGLDVPGLLPFLPAPAAGTGTEGMRFFHAVHEVDPAELVLGEGQELRLVPLAEVGSLPMPPALKVLLRQLEVRLLTGLPEIWAAVELRHRTLDRHCAELGQPLLTMQVVKLQEEVGEAAQALLGVIGANPRKGHSHTLAELQGELCDVIMAGLLALRATTPDAADVLARQVAAWTDGGAGR
ncbi:NUDIX domain-containing protein [Kitasatospora sp. NPDC048540]|uniref:NUDIX domain-containing protein n=1 Tax=Kitasatospora sp. NPDC048540 TaxID=3155634 RepID=UPI0033EACF89